MQLYNMTNQPLSKTNITVYVSFFQKNALPAPEGIVDVTHPTTHNVIESDPDSKFIIL